MAKPSAAWKVLPHEPIEKHSENLWRVLGSLPGMSLRRTMTLARMADGRIVVHSAIALDEASMKEIEAWGSPAFLVLPNGFHRLDALAYKARYPAIKVLAPKGARAKVEEVIALDETLDAFPPDDAIHFEPLAGLADIEAAMFVRSRDGVTVVLGDVVFNMDRKKDPLGFLFTTIFASAPGPRVSRLFKMLAVKDRSVLRSELERLAETPDLVRLVVAHEKLASGPNAAAALKSAAATV